MKAIRKKGAGPRYRVGKYRCKECGGTLCMYNLGTRCFCHRETTLLNYEETMKARVLAKLLKGFNNDKGQKDTNNTISMG